MTNFRRESSCEAMDAIAKKREREPCVLENTGRSGCSKSSSPFNGCDFYTEYVCFSGTQVAVAKKNYWAWSQVEHHVTFLCLSNVWNKAYELNYSF